MKDCFKPCLEEYSSSPQATSLSLVEAVRIIYSCTLSSDTNIDAARIALRSFIASSHEEFAHYLPQFQKETGDFMTELACELLAQLTLLQSSKADLQKTCEKKDGYLAEWRRCYYQLPSKQQNRFFFSGGRVPWYLNIRDTFLSLALVAIATRKIFLSFGARDHICLIPSVCFASLLIGTYL